MTSDRTATGGIRFDADGLVPAIVQDPATGRVLMLGYLSEESLELTRTTGEVHFWSRSREELWRKGETSGNTLAVRDLEVDCDGDAVLVQAIPAGPTCHTGATSCFDHEARDAQGFFWLERLWTVVTQRAEERPEGSYTAQIVGGGVDAATRKVAEEATEVLLAAKDHAAGLGGAGDRLAEEAADLLYHLLVLLAERGVAPGRSIEVLRRRAT